MSDSDSDYEVEQYLKPTVITALLKNDEDGDILGNFDDNKLKHRDKGSGSESNEESSNENDDGNAEMIKKRIKIIENESSDESEEEEESKTLNDLINPPKNQQNGLTEEQLKKLLLGSSKVNRYVLYVTNLSPETTRETLNEFFSQHGKVKSIRIPKKRASNFAFVEMFDQESFQRAFSLHNKMLEGRQIKVQISEAGKKKSANKKNIMKQKNRVLAEMRNESKSFLKSGKTFGNTKTAKNRAWARSKEKKTK